MKKKYILWTLSICMAVTMSTASLAFADTASTAPASTKAAATESAAATEAPAQTAEGNEETTTEAAVKLEPIQLSLEGAYKQLDNSKTMELIKLQKQSDDSAAKGYGENSSSLSKLEKVDAVITGFDTSNKKLLQSRRDFARSMVDKNDEARMNALKQGLMQKYYTLKNTENQVNLVNEGLTLKKSLLATTERRYQVGSASKSEVDAMDKEVQSAQTDLEAAKSSLQQLKQSFNDYLGYNISQEVVLTDSIQEVELPETTLAQAVEAALKNRIEMKTATYNVELSQLNFNSYKAYPSSSSKYIDAKTQLLNAQIALQNKPTDIELDVRSKYDAMMDAYNTVQTGKKTLKNAEDSLNTINRRFQLGMVTSSDVQQVQLALNSAKLSQAGALLGYNLAVESYKLSTGVGISPAAL
ncbi:TolC family protein [Aminipila butyrica]|uniref:TolC family protein n=1 Tax=Aminipila butyrica TaxID=433296 RepID=A0A858BWU9_9FIRM|nr:TolC family protein [Aminipila butyrica]QIB70561.1 TolC family protein [Aminipila butyrica]